MLRAAGDRAFSAGLDVQESFGQPELVWNHTDPGTLLSPKGNELWKPVVCAVHGICTAGAFYFVNESEIVICSPEATFFDSHVTFGMVSAIEPVGLMRRIGLGETLRMALLGNSERVSAETALRIGLVTEIVARGELWTRADQLARTIATFPAAATQGTVRAIWESLDKPYRAAVEQGLMYTRLGNPLGAAELDRRDHGRSRTRRSGEQRAGLQRASARCSSSIPARRRSSSAARGTRGATSRAPPTTSMRPWRRWTRVRARRWGCCSRTTLRRLVCCSACCAPTPAR